MRFSKMSLGRVVTVVFIILLLVYFRKAGFFNSSSDQVGQTSETSARADSQVNSTADGTDSNPDMEFDVTTPRPNELSTSDGGASEGSRTRQAVSGMEIDPACLVRTMRPKSILKCPQIPQKIRDLLRKLNYRITKDDCDIESKTVDITLGRRFIAWTLIQTNSCENRSFPQGLPEEATYNLKDATEVNFPNEFNLSSLEKHFLTHVDFKSAVDEEGQRCPPPKKSSRFKTLGSLESEMTKAQFRFVDDGQRIDLVMKTYMQDELGGVCVFKLPISNWKTFLHKDSRLHGKKTPGQIFQP